MQEDARRERKFKPFEQLTIVDDFMFGKVMREPERCRRLLEIILNIKIREIVIIENEKTIKPDYESRGIRLDIYVEDESQTIYNVEMQTRDEGDLSKLFVPLICLGEMCISIRLRIVAGSFRNWH